MATEIGYKREWYAAHPRSSLFPLVAKRLRPPSHHCHYLVFFSISCNYGLNRRIAGNVTGESCSKGVHAGSSLGRG